MNRNTKPTISTWYRKYRIITDGYCYRPQVWRIWCPLWLDLALQNSFSDIDVAIFKAKAHATKEIVKYL